jgi:hypothetical protein
MKRRNRILRATLITLCSAAIILFIAGIVLSNYVQNRAALELRSLNAKISSLHINLFTRSVTIQEFEWTYLDDSLSRLPHHLTLKKIQFSGISLYQLLRHKKIEVNKITLEDGDFQYNKTLKIKREQSTKKEIDLQGISVDLLALKNINVKLFQDSLAEYSGSVSLSLGGIQLADINKADSLSSYQIKSIEALITKIRINEKESMYRKRISQIYVSSDDHKIIIDSISLAPKYSKYQFSRKVGRQLDRFTGSIPKISITGLTYSQLKDSLFTASIIEITSPRLHVFRDKRLPFIKEKNTPLPMAMIRTFKFGMAIDSVKISDANITYEEFPEKGFHTGHVNFEGLNAVLDHISNRDYYSNYKQSTLVVSSRVMAKGVINVEFSLPYGKEQIYNAKGSISNLALYRLNPILENLAFVSIESGTLHQLNFNFDYNDLKSNGSILINYENLKINSLTKEKESTTNEFKSWIINTILKSDKDKSVSKEKRTGTIDFDRDRKRAIFNLWVKSLFSGLKSSVLDSPNKKEKEK